MLDPNKKVEENLSIIHVANDMFPKELLKLNLSKSCGPDEKHSQIVLELVDYVSESLALFLDKTMDNGYCHRRGKWRKFQ